MLSIFRKPHTLFCAFLLINFGSVAFGQAVVQLTKNSSFESNLSGWNSVQIATKVRTRNWVPATTGAEGRLLTKLVSLNGNGHLGQWITLNANSQFQVVQIQATRKSYIPYGDPLKEGWAGYGISYYDANWKEIHVASQEILALVNADPARTYSGLANYMMGSVVPVQAKYAMIWCANASIQSEVLVDDFSLFECMWPSPIANNLAPVITVPTTNFQNLPLSYYDARPLTYYGHRSLFLRSASIQRSDAGYGVIQPDFGIYNTITGKAGTATTEVSSSNRSITASELLRVQPGMKYNLTLYISNTSAAAGTMGVDFYNAAGTKISTRTAALPENTQVDVFGNAPSKTVSLQLTVPSGTQTAYFWLWVGRGKFCRVGAIDLQLAP